MSVFGNFWCPSGKNFQAAANRTILTPAAFPIAHPEDSENVVVFEILRFWTGVMAAQSQLIRFCVPQKSCFWGSFLQKIASHGQTVHFWLYSVIHNWKALLKSFHIVFSKKYFIDPAQRQIFWDASRQIFSLILRPCHMCSAKSVCISLVTFELLNKNTFRVVHMCHWVLTFLNLNLNLKYI